MISWDVWNPTPPDPPEEKNEEEEEEEEVGALNETGAVDVRWKEG